MNDDLEEQIECANQGVRELYHFSQKHREVLLQYEALPDYDENLLQIQLMDFQIFVEIFSVLMLTEQSQPDGKLANEHLSQLNLALKKVDEILLSDTFYRDNLSLAKQLVTRSESGFLQSMLEFLQTAGANGYISKGSEGELKRAYDQCFTTLESILIKLSTAPVISYDTITFDLIGDIVQATDIKYHHKLLTMFLDTFTALYSEKHRGRAEKFKNQIILKCSSLISLICHLSDPSVACALFKKLIQLNKKQSHEESLVIIQALNIGLFQDLVDQSQELHGLIQEYQKSLIDELMSIFEKQIQLDKQLGIITFIKLISKQ